ncbi:solute carrier family 49 member 4 homolog isoform X2 [Dreissena polymorpha]|uniref:solute carrier family 49 member 4 homolog isoform X2 n=1 Tax=Dreissena polymorpha TaxID=45954 RepID=UPI002263DD60|nr:solute carrier family 49 member 4 homolog isoform X2 [Dreissena polymorpha]
MAEENQLLVGGRNGLAYGTVNQSSSSLQDSQQTTLPNVQIQGENNKIKVYKRRWYILTVYGLMSMTQCAVWNTFSPISEVGVHVFGWDTAGLSLLTNWGPIAYVLGTFQFSWLLDKKGLRPACLISAFLVAAGTGLRCITTQRAVATPLIHFGQFLNGLAGPIAMGGPPLISAEWFPPEQRTTATAVGLIWNTLGLAVSFILGPYLVPLRELHPNNTTMNISTIVAQGVVGDNYTNLTNSFIDYDIPKERDDLMLYMYYSCGWSVFCLLLFFTYFPSKPPLPPSPTASMQRLEFKVGLKKLLVNRTFWLLCFAYGVSGGILSCWQGVLDVNLSDHDVSQDMAGWLGFYGVIATCVAALGVAKADIFAKHTKWFLIGLYLSGGACFIVFVLALISVVPDTAVVLYSTYIIANLLLGASSPLFFEMACEVTYPIAEGITNLVLTLVNNIAGLVFLFVQLIPNIGTMWENWCLLGGIFVCIPVLFLYRESYNRLDIDIIVEEKPKEEVKS